MILLFSTEAVKDRNKFLLDEGMKKLWKREKGTQEKTRHEAMKEFANVINEHLKELAPYLLKGSFISAESFIKLRYLLSFNLDHEEPAVVLRCNLPEVAKSSHFSMYEEEIEEVEEFLSISINCQV